MLIGGIDEAGRGAVIGPMVIAGVVVNEKYIEKLKALGVRDSKTLSPRKREQLYDEIEAVAERIIVMKVPACKIDANRLHGINLDKIEAMKMADIIQFSGADRIFVDSLEQNPKKFETLIRSYLPKDKKFDLVVRNYMDESMPVVSAASIIAKVERDREIQKIKEEVGFDFGVGYSHDPRTIEFLKLLVKRGELPPYVRRTWTTVELLRGESLQKKLFDFFKKRLL